MSTAQNGNSVTVHYTGTLNDGNEFDTSRNRDPLSFQLGSGTVIPGFNDGIVGMSVGETKTIVVPHLNAYGPKIEEAIQEVPRQRFPENFEIRVGEMVAGETNQGQPFNAKIIAEQKDTVTLDFNHPLAGEDLTFQVELLSIV